MNLRFCIVWRTHGHVLLFCRAPSAVSGKAVIKCDHEIMFYSLPHKCFTICDPFWVLSLGGTCMFLNGCICSRRFLASFGIVVRFSLDAIHENQSNSFIGTLFPKQCSPSLIAHDIHGTQLQGNFFSSFPQQIHPLKMKMCYIWRYLRESTESVHTRF